MIYSGGGLYVDAVWGEKRKITARSSFLRERRFPPSPAGFGDDARFRTVVSYTALSYIFVFPRRVSHLHHIFVFFYSIVSSHSISHFNSVCVLAAEVLYYTSAM